MSVDTGEWKKYINLGKKNTLLKNVTIKLIKYWYEIEKNIIHVYHR